MPYHISSMHREESLKKPSTAEHFGGTSRCLEMSVKCLFPIKIKIKGKLSNDIVKIYAN